MNLFDEQVVRGPPTEEQSAKVEVLQCFMLRVYKRRLYLDCIGFIRSVHGKDWVKLYSGHKYSYKGLREDTNAMRDLL